MDYDKYISIKKAAQKIGISRTQVYRLLESDILKGATIGERKLVAGDSVERYIALKFQLEAIRQEMCRPM